MLHKDNFNLIEQFSKIYKPVKVVSEGLKERYEIRQENLRRLKTGKPLLTTQERQSLKTPPPSLKEDFKRLIIGFRTSGKSSYEHDLDIPPQTRYIDLVISPESVFGPESFEHRMILANKIVAYVRPMMAAYYIDNGDGMAALDLSTLKFMFYRNRDILSTYGVSDKDGLTCKIECEVIINKRLSYITVPSSAPMDIAAIHQLDIIATVYAPSRDNNDILLSTIISKYLADLFNVF